MTRRYVVLPARGFRFETEVAPHVPGQVVDRVPRGGPALVEVEPEAAAGRADLRLAPELRYRPAWADRTPLQATAAAATTAVAVSVTSAHDSSPIAGAQVAAIEDLQTGAGAAGVTDSGGHATLNVPPGPLAAVFVTPRQGFWSALAQEVDPTGGLDFRLLPVDPGYDDALRRLYDRAPDDAGAGVKVGVVDTGAGPHPDLKIAGGLNCVAGEDPQEYGDNGLGHGTHVVGIIGGREAMRGLAPAAELMSYRVYPAGSGECSTFAVVKAIDQALADGCRLINLSLALDGTGDDAVGAALAEARDRGVVAFASAGNTMFGPRGGVDYPASDPTVLAVSAMGRLGSFPDGTLEVGETAPPFGTDAENFLARFSNAGPAIALTGPGVGIVSTFPGGYAAMDGTSMACPAACGRAAALLARHPDVLGMPAARARADAVVKLVLDAAAPLGFGAEFEGHGLVK
jgi:subtilisin